MTELLGFTYLAVVALALYLMYRAEHREIERAKRELEGEPDLKRTRDQEWLEAYSMSKSTKTYSHWRDWMEARGYGPESILERAEVWNQVSKRKP